MWLDVLNQLSYFSVNSVHKHHLSTPPHLRQIAETVEQSFSVLFVVDVMNGEHVLEFQKHRTTPTEKKSCYVLVYKYIYPLTYTSPGLILKCF